ncbi:MAG: DinB family protein [Armatimonadetes bacterium]|nr:DinB family protein [Armatimonadota bacterium]
MRSVAELLRQVYDGLDFDGAEHLLGTIKPGDAVRRPPGAPYSIATVIAHADIWQRLWLARLTGAKRPNPFPDFPVIEEAAWIPVRDRFLDSFRLARSIAESEPFKHAMKTDEAAVSTLTQIAVHNAYHMGQVKLIKRLLRAAKA